MTNNGSGSSSDTYAASVHRLDLVVSQFRIALRRTVAGMPMSVLDKLELGLRKKWIQYVIIRALDSNEVCHGELSLMVDWQEYERQVTRGNVRVSIDPEVWTNGASVEIDEAAKLFSRFVQTYSLRTDWVVTYAEHVYADSSLLAQVRRELNLSPASPTRWLDGAETSKRLKIDELPEVTTNIKFIG